MPMQRKWTLGLLLAVLTATGIVTAYIGFDAITTPIPAYPSTKYLTVRVGGAVLTGGCGCAIRTPRARPNGPVVD